MIQDVKKKAAAMHEATDIGTKLTKPQLRELTEMASRDHRSYAWPEYKPIKRLLELGLIDHQPGKGVGMDTFGVTEAGRALLRSLQENQT